MCFANDPEQLAKFRARLLSFTVYKNGRVNNNTGLIRTSYNLDGKDEVHWIKGKTVHPHQIRKPMKGRRCCTSGLYFYTRKEDLRVYGTGKVTASVKPKDVIAVSSNGRIICVVAAKVLDAPNPNQKMMRTKYLKKQLADARAREKGNIDQMKIWEDQRDQNNEAMQQMVDELKKLKA